MKETVADMAKRYIYKNKKNEKKIVSEEFDSIFCNTRKPNKSNNQKNLSIANRYYQEPNQTKNLKIKTHLENTVKSDNYYSGKQPEKILVSLPKNFSYEFPSLLKNMQEDYQDVMSLQKNLYNQKFEEMDHNLNKIDQYLSNLTCTDPSLVSKFAPLLTSKYIVHVEDLTDLLISDLLREEVIFMNTTEELVHGNRELIEYNLKKNKIKNRMKECSVSNGWDIIEKLEQYKSLVCEKE